MEDAKKNTSQHRDDRNINKENKILDQAVGRRAAMFKHTEMLASSCEAGIEG
jgi:hypothetical protein